ncbi:hypothetical protein V1505DRAFT_372849 [Lipomyces doorenjongii]
MRVAPGQLLVTIYISYTYVTAIYIWCCEISKKLNALNCCLSVSFYIIVTYLNMKFSGTKPNCMSRCKW